MYKSDACIWWPVVGTLSNGEAKPVDDKLWNSLHVTICYIPEFNRDRDELIVESLVSNILATHLGSYDYLNMSAKVIGTDMFGENADIPVILLENKPILNVVHRQIEDALIANDIMPSSWPEYRPHVTATDIDVPDYFILGSPELTFTTKYTIF